MKLDCLESVDRFFFKSSHLYAIACSSQYPRKKRSLIRWMKMKHFLTIGNHRTQSFGFRCVFLFESSAKTRALSLSIQFPPIIICTNYWRGVTEGGGRCKRPETDCLRSSTCKMSWTECIFVHKRNLRLCVCVCDGAMAMIVNCIVEMHSSAGPVMLVVHPLSRAVGTSGTGLEGICLCVCGCVNNAIAVRLFV